MKPLKSKNLDNNLFNTISYFSFFGYPPSLDEIHTFFPVKITKKWLKVFLESLTNQKKLISFPFVPLLMSSRAKSRDLFGLKGIPPRAPLGRNDNLDCYNSMNKFLPTNDQRLTTDISYTLPQYTIHFKNRAIRQAIYQKKLVLVNYYIETLAKIPLIQFIGITGSASMGNTTPNDDVDIFIITSKNNLFIGRFFAVVIAHILHVRNRKNGVCLNLFFDESDLTIPHFKQTPYVAHEVLQMKPVVNKNNTYERFLKANKWVCKIFPNATICRQNNLTLSSRANKVSRGIPFLSSLLFLFELVLKTLQLAIIRHNKTGLILSPTQLWLFRKDFEKRMENKMNGQAHL